MKRKMASENYEETNKRKRFTLLQKDEPVYRSNSRNTSPRNELYSSTSNDPFNDEIHGHNGFGHNHNNNRRHSEDHIFTDDTLIVNFKEEQEHMKGEPQAHGRQSVPQRGRPKKKNDSLEWSDEATEWLIDLWRAKGELFDKAHPHFYQREMKDKAVEDIRDGLRVHGFEVTTNQILSKFQSLRTYFCSQRTKLTQGKKYGNVQEDAECKWRFFKSLQFLDDNMKIREGYSQKRRSDSELTRNATPYFRSMVVKEESNMPGNYQESPLSPNSDYNYRQHENGIKKTTEGGLFQNENYKISDTRNDDQLFGELVGNMIQQLPQGRAKDLLKLDIQQLIIKAKYSSTGQEMNSCQQDMNSNFSPS